MSFRKKQSLLGPLKCKAWAFKHVSVFSYVHSRRTLTERERDTYEPCDAMRGVIKFNLKMCQKWILRYYFISLELKLNTPPDESNCCQHLIGSKFKVRLTSRVEKLIRDSASCKNLIPMHNFLHCKTL